MRKTLLFAGIFLAIAFSAIVFIYSNYGQSDTDPKISFTNQTSEPISLDISLTEKILIQRFFWEKSYVMWNGTFGDGFLVEKIHLQLETSPTQGINSKVVSGKNNSILFSLSEERQDSSTLVISLHYDPNYLSELKSNNSLYESLSYDVLHHLLTQSMARETLPGQAFQELSKQTIPKQVNEFLLQNGPIFSPEKSKNKFNPLELLSSNNLLNELEKIHSNVIPVVNAACSGTFTCEIVTGVWCSCSSTGGACSTDGAACGTTLKPGTCDCEYQCNAGSANYCSAFSNCAPNCTGACVHGANNCVSSPSCSSTTWTNWSTCTASCGGGTQYRTNDCGTVESRSCNTQLCPYGCLAGPTNYCARVYWGQHSTLSSCNSACTPSTVPPPPPPSGSTPTPTPTMGPPTANPCPDNAPFLCQHSGSCCRAKLEDCTCAAAACEGDGTNCLRDIDATGCHNTIRPEAPYGYFFCTEDNTCSGDDQGLANANCFEKSKAANPDTYNAFCCGGPKPPPPPIPAPENLAVSCSGINLDPTSPLYGYAAMTISWEPVSGVTSYALRVDDNNDSIDRIVLYGFANDNCAGFAHDVCVTTTQTSNTIYVADPAYMDNVIWWVHSVNPSNGLISTLGANGTIASCIPNCESIQGPTTIEQGQTADFSAIFSSNYAQLSGTFSILGMGATGAYADSMQWPSRSFGLDTKVSLRDDSHFYWDTSAVDGTGRSKVIPGDYTVYCRSFYFEKAECRGTNVDQFPRYLCNGPTSTHTITVTPKKMPITGQIWVGNPTGASCQFDTATSTKWSGANSMLVSVSPKFDATSPVVVNSDGSFAISEISRQYTPGTTTKISLGGTLPDGYTFACPASGSTDVDVSFDTIEPVDFYITSIRDPWWQVAGGSIFSAGGISGKTPFDTCTAETLCSPYLLSREIYTDYTQSIVKNPLSASVPISSGSIEGYSGWLTDRVGAYNSNVEDVSVSHLVQEDYDTFAQKIDFNTAALNVWGESHAAVTSTADFSGATVYGDTEFHSALYGMSLVPTANTISITGGRKVVVFVQGNLYIDASNLSPGNNRVTQVAEGSNLIFLIKGSLIIRSNVGTDIDVAANEQATTIPNLEGVFIASKSIIVEKASSNEKRFVGAGSFIAYENIELQRDFNTNGVEQNKVSPTELFIFRPDFVANFPEILKSSSTAWKEVN